MVIFYEISTNRISVNAVHFYLGVFMKKTANSPCVDPSVNPFTHPFTHPFVPVNPFLALIKWVNRGHIRSKTAKGFKGNQTKRV